MSKVTIPFRDGPRNVEFVLMSARDSHTILYEVIFGYVLPAIKDESKDLMATLMELSEKLTTEEFFDVASKVMGKFKVSGHEIDFNDGEYFNGELMALYQCVFKGLKANFDPFLPDLRDGESLQTAIEALTKKVKTWAEGLTQGALPNGNTPSTS